MNELVEQLRAIMHIIHVEREKEQNLQRRQYLREAAEHLAGAKTLLLLASVKSNAKRTVGTPSDP